MALIVIGCLLVYFLFIELLKYISFEEPAKFEKTETISIAYLPLPKEIEQMTEFTVSSIVRKIFDTYTKFDYKNATEEQLDEKQWHSWQISMIMKLYKFNQEFYIRDKESIFPKSVLNLNMHSLESLAQSLVVKYNNSVVIAKSRDALCKDIIWTVRDVSVLFYYLSKYREL